MSEDTPTEEPVETNDVEKEGQQSGWKQPEVWIAKYIEPHKAAPGLLVLALLVGLYFFSSPFFQILINGYIGYTFYRILITSKDVEDDIGLKLQEFGQKALIGLAVFTSAIFLFGGPENIVVPGAIRGTWYHPVTCEEFDVGFRSGSADSIMRHSSNGDYSKLITLSAGSSKTEAAGGKGDFAAELRKQKREMERELRKQKLEMKKMLKDSGIKLGSEDAVSSASSSQKSEFASFLEAPHRFRSNEVRESIFAELSKGRKIDEERLKRLSDLNDNTWSKSALSIPMSGGMVESDSDSTVIEYESISMNDQTGSGTVRQENGQLNFIFVINDQEVEMTFLKEKPTTCIPDPVSYATEQAPLLKAEMEELQEKVAAMVETDRSARATSGSKAIVDEYPHPCDNVDPDLHAPIVGDKKSCVPTDLGTILSSVKLGKEQSVPSGFSDGNPFSYFINPISCKKNGWGSSYKFTCEEETEFSSAERTSKKNIAKKTLFRKEIYDSNCKKEYLDDTYTIKFSCELPDNLYASGSAYFKEINDCEAGTYSSCGYCSSNSDCKLAVFFGSGCADGCSTSRCVGGRCTSCYTAGLCNRSYEMRGIKPFTFTKQFDADTYADAKKVAEENLEILFMPVSGYRKTYANRYYSDEEKEITGQSELYIKVSPKVIHAEGIAFYTAKSFSFKLNDTVTVSCTSGRCTSKK